MIDLCNNAVQILNVEIRVWGVEAKEDSMLCIKYIYHGHETKENFYLLTRQSPFLPFACTVAAAAAAFARSFAFFSCRCTIPSAPTPPKTRKTPSH